MFVTRKAIHICVATHAPPPFGQKPALVEFESMSFAECEGPLQILYLISECMSQWLANRSGHCDSIHRNRSAMDLRSSGLGLGKTNLGASLAEIQ